MVSGAPLFYSLFNNLALFIALVAIYGSVVGSFGGKTAPPWRRQAALGMLFGSFALGCMYSNIPVTTGVVVDQRNAIVALSGAFGGPVAAVISAAITASYRAYLGGQGVLSGTTGVALAALAGIGIFQFYGPLDTPRKAAVGALVATLLILPGFLLVGNVDEGWALLQRMALPYGGAIFLGVFLGALLLAREDRRHHIENRFREMVALAPDAIVVLDTKGRILLFNDQAEKLSGKLAEDVLGAKLADIDWFARESLRLLEQRLATPSSSERASYAPISATAKVLELRSTATKRSVEVSFGSVAHSTDGFEWLLVIRDVSARRQAEEERLQLEARLSESKSLEALGRLAGGVAHDFNNLLTVIIGAATEHDERELDAELRQDLDDINEAAHRAAGLTAQLLAFGRKQVLEPQVQSPATLLEGLVPLLKRLIPENVKLSVDCESSAGYVRVDVSQFEQVIVNLVANSCSAMPRGGTLRVAVNRRENDDGSQSLPGVPLGSYVETTVCDTGNGMSEEVRSRVFEPFFTTKSQTEGTGLGLATVHGIVKQSGGFIHVESELGHGSCFRVLLPSTEEPLSVTAAQAHRKGTLPSGSQVLLVDDDAMVRRSVRRMLTSLGFSVSEADSGEEALRTFDNSSQRFELVLTDVVMTGMGGGELSEAIRKREDGVRILFMSGYTDDAIVRHNPLGSHIPLIRKPFTRRKLELMLRQVLTSDPPEA